MPRGGVGAALALLIAGLTGGLQPRLAAADPAAAARGEKALTTTAFNDHPVDPDRVMVTGFSMGGVQLPFDGTSSEPRMLDLGELEADLLGEVVGQPHIGARGGEYAGPLGGRDRIAHQELHQIHHLVGGRLRCVIQFSDVRVRRHHQVAADVRIAIENYEVLITAMNDHRMAMNFPCVIRYVLHVS